VLEQLNILEGYDLAALAPFSAERMHLLVEAKKLASRTGIASRAIPLSFSGRSSSLFPRAMRRCAAPR
jgi:hypothetical protein